MEAEIANTALTHADMRRNTFPPPPLDHNSLRAENDKSVRRSMPRQSQVDLQCPLLGRNLTLKDRSNGGLLFCRQHRTEALQKALLGMGRKLNHTRILHDIRVIYKATTILLPSQRLRS